MSEASNMNRIDSLRRTYEREVTEKKKKFAEEIKAAEKELEDILSEDYTEAYRRKYESSLASLERIYESLAAVHRRTRGISFRIYEYIVNLRPRTVEMGGVEDYFYRLVSECKRAIAALNAGKSIEEDIPHAKIFCQGLCDLRYVVKNAAKLLSESDAPEEDKRESSREAREKLSALREREKRELRFENLDCYRACKNMREELIALGENGDDRVLGGKLGFDESYAFFMGYATYSISEENRRFIQNVLGVSNLSFTSSTPIFFKLTPDHSTIIIRAKNKYFSSADFKGLLRNLYFTFASHLPKRGLTFTGIEFGAREAVALGIENQIKSALGDAYVFSPVSFRERDLSGTGSALDAVINECHNRSGQYNFVDDIFEYNRQNPETTQRFIMFCANNYPNGYNGNDTRPAENILDLAISGAKGVITVICDSTDGNHEGGAIELDPNELNASVIDINERGIFWDGMPASLFPTSKDFEPRGYWQILNKYCSGRESLWLKKVLSDADSHIKSGQLLLPPKGKKLPIPLGMGDGRRYDLELDFKSTSAFGIIVGSTGSGKSSLLHSIILSACSYYSPEEIELYLVDFKSNSKTAPEFSHYKREDGVDNLYMPQIKYLLLKSRSENALDLLTKIELLFNEKNAILGNLSIQEYNRREDEKKRRGEPYKKLPYSIFIIDEVNRMLGGDFESAGSAKNSMVTSELSKKLDSVLRLVRSAGIGIIFAGQTTDGFESRHLDQVGNRIVLKGENENNLRALFKFSTLTEPTEIFKKTVKGTGLVTVELDGRRDQRFVSLAFAGDPWSDEAKDVARKVREKYGYLPQIEAGSEAAFPAAECKDFMAVETDPKLAKAQKDYLLLGMSSATSDPVFLKYMRRDNTKNYYAFADSEKLLAIERTAILSFLRSTGENGLKYSTPRVTYCALEGEIERAIGAPLKAAPELSRHIERLTDRRAVAEHILDLAATLRDRLRTNKGEISTYPPTLTVIHGIEWLMRGQDTYWLPDFKKTAPKAATPAAPAPSAAELDKNKADAKQAFAQATGGAQADDDILGMLAMRRAKKTATAAEPAAPTVTVAEKQEREPYTDDDVRMALKELFLKGNRHGMLLFVSSPLLAPVKSMLFEPGGFSEKYAVYGSFAELQKGECDEEASETCVFVNPSFAKTRLLHFTDADAKSISKALK